jgi:hypothetical protein
MLRALAAAASLLLAAPTGGEPAAQGGDALLLTIFLRHDQSRPLAELNAQLDKLGWRERFPPPGVDVARTSGGRSGR